MAEGGVRSDEGPAEIHSICNREASGCAGPRDPAHGRVLPGLRRGVAARPQARGGSTRGGNARFARGRAEGGQNPSSAIACVTSGMSRVSLKLSSPLCEAAGVSGLTRSAPGGRSVLPVAGGSRCVHAVRLCR